MNLGFEVERIDTVIVAGPEELITQNLMSPFMWRASCRDAGLMAEPCRAAPSRQE